MSEPQVSVGLVEDHPLMRMGVDSLLSDTDAVNYVGGFPTVDSLLAIANVPDIVLLDLRLSDNSDPSHNVYQLKKVGAKVLVFTSAEDPYQVRRACQAGAAGVVRKADANSILLEAILELAQGGEVAGMDWAAALDSDEQFVSRLLTEAEQRVLAEYACGLTSRQVARKLGLSVHTVNSYVRDIRRKYEAAGCEAGSRVDLYIHAVRHSLAPSPAELIGKITPVYPRSPLSR